MQFPIPNYREAWCLQTKNFFITDPNDTTALPRILPLSGEEKKLLRQLTTPVGNVVASTPMVAKRLRNKLNVVLSSVDIVTIRGRGYKLVHICANDDNNGEKK